MLYILGTVKQQLKRKMKAREHCIIMGCQMSKCFNYIAQESFRTQEPILSLRRVILGLEGRSVCGV
jgi:hypothetical protein